MFNKFYNFLPQDSFPLIEYCGGDAAHPWPGEAVIILPSHQVQEDTKVLVTWTWQQVSVFWSWIMNTPTFSVIHIGPQAHFVPKHRGVKPLGVDNKTVAVPHLLMNL